MTDSKWVYYYNEPQDQHRVMILDYEWYAAHDVEIENWMQENLRRGRDSLLGMVLTFDSEAEMLLWSLRWS